MTSCIPLLAIIEEDYPEYAQHAKRSRSQIDVRSPATTFLRLVRVVKLLSTPVSMRKLL